MKDESETDVEVGREKIGFLTSELVGGIQCFWMTTLLSVCCGVVTLHSAAGCSHLSGSPSGKLVFVLVEKDFDELVYLYAKEI